MSSLNAVFYDAFMAPLEALGFARMRTRVLDGLAGKILEIGMGTGLTLPHYPESVTLVGLEPETDKHETAHKRAHQAGLTTELVEGKGEALPFEDNSFDGAVLALVLCTIPDPDLVLKEVIRVVKPGGAVRLLEHVISPKKGLAGIQALLTPTWKIFSSGCHLDRDTLSIVKNSGLTIDEIEPHLSDMVLEIYARTPQ
ncbi:class I SAM-dependent methyltransferase [Myxococcota bacterium]|nr:class I SAM-dependent methyltransferase [Myxococcota bacterium]